MWDSANTTAGWTSQLSFHEYPPHKPFINSTYRTLRPSATAALPESNRDHLFTALQSLTLRIKSLEKEREEAQSNLRQITGGILRPTTSSLPEERPKKTRAKKRVSPTSDVEGRHYHLDMNSVPFILGASTAPSHNVKSNVQNVIALLKSHNHQLCLTSKEYAEMLQPHLKGDLSPHTLLYLDHYQRTAATSRPSSASPVRHRPRRRPQIAAAVTSEKKCYSRMKHLRQEFATLTREHQRLNTSRSNPRELEIINRRMEIILEELDQLQRQLRQTTNRRSTSIETPLETLRKTRLLQVILKDASQKEQHQGRSHRRTRPPTSSSVDG